MSSWLSLSFAAVSRDLRFGARNLSRSLGFTSVAVLALAAGIGLNTALFTVVKSVLLDPLPFPGAERLVAVHESLPKYEMSRQPVSTIEFKLMQKMAKSFESLGAYESITGELSSANPSEMLSGAKLTASMLDVLGVRPLLGRSFTEQEDYDGSAAMVLSYRLWQRRFGGDPAVIGRAVDLDRTARTIIGVMPPAFIFPLRGPADNSEPADFYVPMGFTALEQQGRGPVLQKSVIGRLRPDSNIEGVNAEVATMIPGMMQDFPGTYLQGGGREGLAFDVVPLRREITGSVRTVLWLLLAAVGVLLLIACANVANLMLARAAGRRGEFAIRAAIGASRGELVRMMLCESFVISAISGILGLALAVWGRRLLLMLSPIQMPRIEEVRLQFGVVGFAFLVVLATTVLCGIAAALQHSRTSPAEALKDSARTTTAGRGSHRIVANLVSAQFALTVVLLIAGALMMRTLMNTLAADPGFRPAHVVAVTTHLPPTFYSHAAQIHGVYLQVAAEAEQAPGIEAAGIGTELPLGNWEKGTIIPEVPGAAAAGSGPIASQVWVTGRYLEALGVALKRGRFFDPVEYKEARGVVIINEALAAKLWPNQDAVGRRLRNSRTTWATVIGVVGNIKEIALNAPAPPQIYEPHSQLPDRLMEMASIPFFHTINLVSRSRSDANTQLRQLTVVIQHADSSLAISGATSLDAIVQESSRPQRLNALLIAGFGGLALLLAVLGVASVLGYAVVQRRSEIGLRIALGAQQGDVLRLIMGQGLRLAAVGIAAGIATSMVTTRLLSSFLYGVRASDPLTFTAVPLLLIGVALLVSYLPALRASRVDPMIALRDN